MPLKPLTDQQIREIQLRATRDGDKRLAKLCEVALDDWYFSPTARQWARERLQESKP